MPRLPASPELKQKAKDIYFKHEGGATYIARRLDLGRSQVQDWIDKQWRNERSIRDLETLQELKSKKTPQLMEILDKSGDIILRFLRDLLNREEPIKPWEMTYVFRAQESIDKVYRLEQNKPTEIIQEEKAIDAVELVKKIRATDPFSDLTQPEIIEEGSYEEITDDSTTGITADHTFERSETDEEPRKDSDAT
jgi:transposase-like protein